MRALTIAVLGLGFLAATACSSSTSSSSSCSGMGAAATVDASDANQFSPSTATITHGQSVCWQNTGSAGHTVTSNDGTSFNSSLPSGGTYIHTFATAGSFPYHCTIHPGMNGTITVN